jgi:MoaA/NifB/PqqE/SkfB family radical SAM enzyme
MPGLALPAQGSGGIPKVIAFEVTNRCNLKCVMCPHGIGAIESPRDADMSLLDALWPGMVQAEYVHLNGVGEPMMAKPFWEVIDRLKGKKRPLRCASDSRVIIGSVVNSGPPPQA